MRFRITRRSLKYKRVSLAKANHRSNRRLISKALRDAWISDTKFASIMSEIEKCFGLKAKLKKYNSQNALEKVDNVTLREEIKKIFQRELGSLLTLAKS